MLLLPCHLACTAQSSSDPEPQQVQQVLDILVILVVFCRVMSINTVLNHQATAKCDALQCNAAFIHCPYTTTIPLCTNRLCSLPPTTPALSRRLQGNYIVSSFARKKRSGNMVDPHCMYLRRCSGYRKRRASIAPPAVNTRILVPVRHTHSLLESLSVASFNCCEH